VLEHFRRHRIDTASPAGATQCDNPYARTRARAHARVCGVPQNPLTTAVTVWLSGGV